MGVTITFCLWWMYFSDFNGLATRGTAQLSNLWIYGHLPLHLFHALLGMLMATTLSFVQGDTLPSPLPQFTMGVAGCVFLSSAFLTYVNSVEQRGTGARPTSSPARETRADLGARHQLDRPTRSRHDVVPRGPCRPPLWSDRRAVVFHSRPLRHRHARHRHAG